MATLKPRLVKGISYHDKVAGFAQFFERSLAAVYWLAGLFRVDGLSFLADSSFPNGLGHSRLSLFDAKCLDGVLFSNQLLI